MNKFKIVLMIFIITLIAVTWYCGVPKNHFHKKTIGATDYIVKVPFPGFTYYEPAGTAYLKYHTLLPFDQINKFYLKQSERLTKSGYVQIINDYGYVLFYSESLNEIIYVPTVDNSVYNSLGIGAKYRIDYPLFEMDLTIREGKLNLEWQD